jgi:hypothetical protein
MYYVGAAAAVLLVLFVIGIINNKGTHGMAAVAAGLADCFTWAGQLIGQLLSHL